MVKKRQKKEKSTKESNWQKVIFILVLVLFFITATGFIWIYRNYQESQQTIKNLKTKQQKQQVNKQKKKELIKKLARHIELPETSPAVVTISNPKKLAEQESFFKPAKKGDILFLYKTKAILYRSSTDKIIDVQPVTTQGSNIESREAEQLNQNVEEITVEVRNGGAASGSASNLADKLRQQSQFSVEDVTNASTTTFENNILIDNNPDVDIRTLENALGIKATSTIPDGVLPSTADAIIILTE